MRQLRVEGKGTKLIQSRRKLRERVGGSEEVTELGRVGVRELGMVGVREGRREGGSEGKSKGEREGESDNA